MKQQNIDSKTQEGIKESCNLIFLGNEKNGQRSLVRRVQGKDVSGEVYHDTLSVEYTFLNVHNLDELSESRYDDKLLNIYQMESHHFSFLLDFALNSTNLDKTIIVITADISKPKDLITNIKTWIKEIENHIHTNILPQLSPEQAQCCYDRGMCCLDSLERRMILIW